MILKKIESIATVVRGSSPRPKGDPKYYGGPVPRLMVSDVSRDGMYVTPVIDSLTLEGAKKSRPMLKGDIVIAVSGDPGEPSILNVDACIHDGFVGLRKLKTDVVITEYVYHFLKFSKEINKSGAVGAIYKNLTTTQINNLLVPIPSLKTQQKIAAILDEADRLRRLNKELIATYEQLGQSLFLEMFGSLKGEEVSLSSLCEINPRKSEIADVEKSTIVSFVPMANVSEEGEVQLKETRKIFDVWSSFTYFKEDDVLFAKITPCMENGKGAIMKNLVNSIGFGSTEFHVLRPVLGVSTSEWLYHLTSSVEFRKIAEQNMTGSAGQKRVPTSFLANFKMVPPPFYIQNDFTEKIRTIKKQKLQAQQALEHSEELFNSLLQKAFKGELV